MASVLVLAFAAAGTACAKNPTSPAPTAGEASAGIPEHQGMGSGMMGMMNTGDECPMATPGTSVQAAEAADGMTMTFTTRGDAAELRKRVRAMASRMNAHPSGGMGMHDMMMGGADGGHGMMGGGMGMSGGMMAADGGHAMMSGTMPQVRAQAEDVEGGARLRLTPLDPSRLGELKQHMKEHAQMMNDGHGCPMMGGAQ
jgi:hypothetical protein